MMITKTLENGKNFAGHENSICFPQFTFMFLIRKRPKAISLEKAFPSYLTPNE